MTSAPAHSIDFLARKLRDSTRGHVVTAEDPEYDGMRRVFVGDVDRRPGAIARVADADDVRQVIAVARDSGAELAVRSGGHSSLGHGTTDGGIVLDLRDLDGIEIDAAGRTAWAGAGMTAAAYTGAAGEHGLATGFGDTGSVGIGGITLGGGVGFLVRKHGLTIDSLLAAEIVTADGRIRTIDDDHDPDLFWAIRGGGGNFGVATRFLFRLHPVDEFVGGLLLLPATPEVVAGFIAAAEAAPDELSTIANVMPAPPMPFLPPEWHGRLVVMAFMAFAGRAADADGALAPFRALEGPVADLVRRMPYAEMYPPEDESYRPTAVARTMFIDRVDGALANTIVERLEASDAAMRAVQLRVLGGAVARVSPEATAYAHRQSRIMVNVATFYEGPEDRPGRAGWVEDVCTALHQSDDGAYVNFLADDGPQRIHAAYPGATWERLAAAKGRYDPGNLFRLNQNIAPAVS
ncbi:MAG TPA: FAD-binding oxidoreductase [Candidatus Limnocylindrales bacterium]|nr:FAD-binding oxidoreductase [Candidatus Limnocylindrales bacterium]